MLHLQIDQRVASVIQRLAGVEEVTGLRVARLDEDLVDRDRPFFLLDLIFLQSDSLFNLRQFTQLIENVAFDLVFELFQIPPGLLNRNKSGAILISLALAIKRNFECKFGAG